MVVDEAWFHLIKLIIITLLSKNKQLFLIEHVYMYFKRNTSNFGIDYPSYGTQ